MPRRRQAGEGQRPVEEALPLDRCGGGEQRHLTVEAARRQRRRGVRIAQDVDEVERPLAEKPLGVDGEPAAVAAIEDVAVMDVAVQDDDVARIGQQRLRRRVRLGEQAAMCPCGRRQGREPARQRDEFRRRSGARRMQAQGHVAEDAARLIVPAGRDHFRERARPGGALQQQRLAVPGQNLRGAVAVPPRHQRTAAALLFLARDLEHGRHAIVAHGQQQG